MSTNLVPVQDIQTMAEAVAKSKLFGVKTVEEAMSLMLIAQAEGMHPASAARDYHIIQGKASKKAEAMLRDFLKSGGNVEWHGLDDAKADATFSHPQGGSVRISWDMARMKKAKISNADMYEKYPRQMLRSRCVAEGVRTVCPLATGGMYTPEEVQSMPAKEIDAEVMLSESQIADHLAAIEAATDGPSADAAWKSAAAAAKTAKDMDAYEKFKAKALAKSEQLKVPA